MKTPWLYILGIMIFFETGIFMNIHAAEETPKASLPVSLAFEYRDGKPSAIRISNISGKNRELVSNLPQVMETLFLGFPTEGSLQLKDARGEVLTLKGQNPDGWWYPSMLSSSLDIQKNQMLGKASTLKLAAGENKSYPFEVLKILASAKSNLDEHREREIKQYRLRISFFVEPSDGKKEPGYVISQWVALENSK